MFNLHNFSIIRFENTAIDIKHVETPPCLLMRMHFHNVLKKSAKGAVMDAIVFESVVFDKSDAVVILRWTIAEIDSDRDRVL